MGRGHLVLEQAIDAIIVGHQYRRDLGDLTELCESIDRVGLLAPPVLTTENVLISGNRRLAAMRQLGKRTVPVWIATGVSDKLSTVLAIQDENTLHKDLTPLEQAELYSELKQLLAEENARRQTMTRFGSRTATPENTGDGTPGHGGWDSQPPQGGGKSRIQAATAVTGRDSSQQLEQVLELERIAASDREDDLVRQHAAEALVEINQDGKVNSRYLQVKRDQTLTTLGRLAEDPAVPDAVRHAAAAALVTVQTIQQPRQAVAEATRALNRIGVLRKDTAARVAPVGWSDVDPELRQKHECRKLADLLRREHGWWTSCDAAVIGQYATDEQWDLITGYVTNATAFVEEARQVRGGGTAT